ncbi:MAG: sarcosine oxidase subunit gamma family protein [Nocardioidaceae bacterium]
MPETVPERADHHAWTPVARSPLALVGTPTVTNGWEYSAGAVAGPVVVADRSAMSKVHIRVATNPAVTSALGTRFGRAVWAGDRLIVGSGPDEWLVLGPPGKAAEIAGEFGDAVRGVDPGSMAVVDLTHGRALVRLSGPETLTLLRRVTAVDLDDRLVPNGSALRTSLARVVTDLIRDDVQGSPSYLVHCERSSGRYLQQSLLAAGSDLGAVGGASAPAWPDHH